MNKNKELNDAKRNKCDEFYTQYEDIEEEMKAYLEYDSNVFRDKSILLPCDNYKYSNFTKYFRDNFDKFGLRELISTSYNENGNGNYLLKKRERERNCR